MVTVANEVVPIATVLRWFGVDGGDVSERSRKLRCPFGQIYHSDHGVAPALRVYPDTNSAYCFSCTWYLTPVSLAARGWDVDRRTAAERLLTRVGHRPLDLASQWRAAAQYTPELDKSLSAQALKTYCRRISSSWESRQFEPQVAADLTRCLALLDLVTSAEDHALWLTSCKTVMRRALEEAPEPSVSQDDAVF